MSNIKTLIRTNANRVANASRAIYKYANASVSNAWFIATYSKFTTFVAAAYFILAPVEAVIYYLTIGVLATALIGFKVKRNEAKIKAAFNTVAA